MPSSGLPFLVRAIDAAASRSRPRCCCETSTRRIGGTPVRCPWRVRESSAAWPSSRIAACRACWSGRRDGLLSFDARGHARRRRARGAGRVTAIAPERDALWAVVDESEVWHRADRRAWDPRRRRWSRCVGRAASPRRTRASWSARPRRGCSASAGRRCGSSPSTRSTRRTVARAGTRRGAAHRTRDRSRSGTRRSTSTCTWAGSCERRTRERAFAPTIDVDEDVHQVTTAEGLVLAACAGGLAVSTDRGRSWTMRTEGLEARYSRGVVVCGDAVLVSASRGPRGGRAAVYRGDLAGGGFERCRDGSAGVVRRQHRHALSGRAAGRVVGGVRHVRRRACSCPSDTGLEWTEIASGLSADSSACWSFPDSSLLGSGDLASPASTPPARFSSRNLLLKGLTLEHHVC